MSILLSLEQTTASANHLQAPHQVKPHAFSGTDNPRHLRAMHALLIRPRARQELNVITGASNLPDLVADLRKLGLKVPCERIETTDRDGRPCRPGVYYLTPLDRRAIRQWQSQRGAQA